MTNETDMTSAKATLDIEPLLAPLAGDNPAGESIRYEGTYDAIQEARREDDPSLPQGVWKTELKQADWKEAESLCTAALREKSKDLQIAAWLTEAWIHRYRLAGATAGLKLLRGLNERYWDHLYPALDGDDLDPRLAPFEWVNDKLPAALKLTRIAESARSERTLTWGEWESALYHETNQAQGKAAPQEGEESSASRRETLLALVHATSTEFFHRTSDELAQTTDALRRLDSDLDTRCGAEAPSFRGLHDLLEAISHFVGRIVKERDAMEEEVRTPVSDTLPQGGDDGASLTEPEPSEAPSGPIASRADAYRTLAAAADYLTAHEPHSPAPYLVRRAIKWGRMSLAELLRELLRDNADLPTVYNLLGIRDSDTFEE